MEMTLLNQSRTLLVASLLGCGLGWSDFRTYEANIEQADWQFDGNPVFCSLSHSIPRYGLAEFKAKASRTPNMAFILDAARNPIATGKVIDIRSVAPEWRPGKLGKEIGVVPVVPGEKTLNVLDDVAWKLLIALEQGMSPSFYYRDFKDDSDRVSVALSTVNFQRVYSNFIDCVEELLPYDFWEIQHTMINFDFNGSKLTEADRKKLDVLAEFLKHDPNIEAVLVEGHTDSIAFRRYNKALGQKRANSVSDYLKSKGVEKQKIRAVSHGEMKPLESNHTAEGRALNRRVFITMQRG